jgi:hypothetical protein
MENKSGVLVNLSSTIFASLYFPIIYTINHKVYDPFPEQSLDFRLAGLFSTYSMALTDGKNKKTEFLAAMLPAVIGSIDEYTDFFHKVFDTPPNVASFNDVIAYFSASLLTYFGYKYFRNRINEHT